VGIGAAILVFGVALLSAQALTWISRWLHRGLGAAFGVNGRLAADNIRRQPRRAGITASALMIGVLLLSLSATVTESAKVSVRDSFDTLIHSDAIVSGDLMGPPVDVSDTAIGIIRSEDGVELTSLIGWGTATVDDRNIMLGAIEADTIEATYTYPAEPTLSHIGNGAVIGPRMVAWGYGLGDTITVVGQDATLDLVVTGVHTVDGDPDVFVDWPLGQQLDDEITTWMVMINFEEGTDADATLAAITDGLDEFPLLQVSPPEAVAKSFSDFFDQMLIIITVMLSASLVIAILGVANTLLLSITERTRELGLLRAVGASRKSVRRMITLESVIMSLFGALLGIVLGTGLGVALVIALKSFGLGTVVVPTMWLVVYAVLAILAGILAAIVPAWRASRIDILKAVTTE
jgi:putative ABC transport system permease protein